MAERNTRVQGVNKVQVTSVIRLVAEVDTYARGEKQA